VLKYELTDAGQVQLVTLLGVDVWSHESVAVIGMNQIMVSSAQKHILEANGIFHKEVMIADVEKHLSDERETLAKLREQPNASWFDTYHDFDGIVAHYKNLSAQYPSLSKFIPSIGKTIQERDIPGFTIGNPEAKKKIYFEGGQHAREWVSHSTVAFIVEHLLDLSDSDPLVKELVSNIQFVIVPVVNPDGYVFTWGTNRLWRKNRRANTGGSFGVDLNRNWDDHFGGEGSSNVPSSDTYHGTAPFSEPETQAASDFYSKSGPFVGAIDFHSYSQLVLRPYGWTRTAAPNEAEAKLVGDGIRDEIRKKSGVQYTSEPSWQLYFTAGTAQDWWYAAGKAPLSYTIELRDTGTYGFQLPPAQIIPTGEENWEAFKFFAQFILKRN